MNPGVFTISAPDYHADKIAEEPSLSSSLAHILCTSSPAHAKVAHPRLNPGFERTEEDKFDVGTAAHALLLQGEDIVEIVDAADWRTNVAKEARDEARALGRIPLLAKHWDNVRVMADAVQAQLPKFEATPTLFTDGKPEQTLVWDDGGVTCRARLDWLHDDYTAIDDLETTMASADPNGWTRTLFNIGADIQVAFYLRGLQAVTGSDADFRFVVAETYPPYAVSVVSLAPEALAFAQDKVEHALKLWRRCLEKDEWPAYPLRVAWAEAPSWEVMRWMEREELAEAA